MSSATTFKTVSVYRVIFIATMIGQIAPPHALIPSLQIRALSPAFPNVLQDILATKILANALLLANRELMQLTLPDFAKQIVQASSSTIKARGLALRLVLMGPSPTACYVCVLQSAQPARSVTQY